MPDRTIVYSGSLPQSTDYLTVQRNTMIAFGFLAQATLGTTTVADGLACTPTTVAGMTVNVGPGSIVALETIDATAYGSLPADNTDALVKMGVNSGTTNIAMTAPTTSGQSINYLIQAAFQESDATAVVLPYYNSANPAVPYSGPTNSGAAQNTQRLQRVNLQLKSGTPAATGSQVTPTPDAGYVGLWVITVAFAQTTITAPNISVYGPAPFVYTKISKMRRRLTSNMTLYVATNGNDNNSGISPYNAFLTLQGAWNYVISNLDLAGFNVTISVADGTYTNEVFCTAPPCGVIGSITNEPPQPGPNILFQSTSGNAANCIINVANGNCFHVGGGSQVSISGFTLKASGGSANYNTQGCALYTFANGGIQFSNIIFGTCSLFHIASTTGSTISSLGNPYTIAGSASCHINANAGGYTATAGSSVTLTGTPNFSAAFAAASSLAYVNANTMTFSGSATGKYYDVELNGAISGTLGAATYFPGSITGTTATGGQYA